MLRRDGVSAHPGHRAVLPDDFAGDRLTTDPVAWSTGQPPFSADVTIWAVGRTRPPRVPSECRARRRRLRARGCVPARDGYPGVFAVGDVAASDPNRSSARKLGLAGRGHQCAGDGRGGNRKLARYRAPEYRWGSVLGLQSNGLVVVQPNGRRFRVPRNMAEPLLFRLFVTQYLYGGIRKDAGARSRAQLPAP